MVGALALNLGMPCLVFSSLTRLNVSLPAFGEMVGAYAIVMLCFFLIGLVVIKTLKVPAHTYLPIFTSSNTGNMGLPLCLFAFGSEGLAFGVCIFILSSIYSFTVGWSIYAGRLAADVLYNNPLIYAVALALLFMLTNTNPPDWLANTTELISGLAIPLMLISLGVAIADLRVRRTGKIVIISFIKLLAGFIVGYAVGNIFGMEGSARGVLIIGAAMPIAVHNYMFAQRFARNSDDTAGMIVISTILSLATLPLLMYLAL